MRSQRSALAVSRLNAYQQLPVFKIRRAKTAQRERNCIAITLETPGMHTESPSWSVYAIETLQRNHGPALCDSALVQAANTDTFTDLQAYQKDVQESSTELNSLRLNDKRRKMFVINKGGAIYKVQKLKQII